jgi:glycosyltransferase involved in cell wall biosynthesis
MKIVIWTGPAWETWGPASLKTGIGGSELAAIHMAAGLANLDHDVEVIGQVNPEVWNGARFSDFREYVDAGAKRIACDVFVSSRHLPALQLEPTTRLSVLWMHDIHVGADPHGFMKEYDIVFNLSGWARDTARRHYPGVPTGRFVVTRNGIDTKLFAGPVTKEGCKVVYSSSPDRGLDKLLDWWSAIRAMRPDAELHIYYGFDTWERMANLRKDKIAKLQIGIFRTRLASMEGQGVVAHGRVGQEELARAWMGASLWLYPTSFCETSCITAMEAQAAGAWPITSRLAALPETIRHGDLIDPPNTRDGYQEEFLEHTRSFLEGADSKREDRQGLNRIWTLENMDWQSVANQWDQLFRERLGG